MKVRITSLLFLLFSLGATAQSAMPKTNDSTTFLGYLFNDEYDVYMNIDFYSDGLLVPHQEIFGKVPGFFGDKHDGRKWIITNAEIKDKKTAQLSITNDYGSEDLEAVLRCTDDSTYVLEQGRGSTIKIARNRKWVKMPKKLTFIKKSTGIR